MISVCFKLEIFEPLIKIFTIAKSQPDYLSCFNILFNKFLENRSEKIFEILLKLVKSAIKNSTNFHFQDQSTNTLIFKQALIWVLDTSILTTLTIYSPQSTLKLLEEFFQKSTFKILESVKNVEYLESCKDNFYMFPTRIYERIKMIIFKSASVDDDEKQEEIVENFNYFSAKMSLKQNINMPTSDVIFFLSNINPREIRIYDEIDQIEFNLSLVVSKFSSKMTELDFQNLLEIYCEKKL